MTPVDPVKLPFPFKLHVGCDINGRSFSADAVGAVGPVGVYTAKLTFSELPPAFHPVVISGFTLSICCYYTGGMRNGALNLHELGAEGYDTERVLRFENAGEVRITGNVRSKNDTGLSFDGHVEGEVNIPSDIIGFAQYYAFYRSAGPNKINGWGEGTCFRESGTGIKVDMTEKYTLTNMVTLPWPLYRVVNEHGKLDGLTYTVQLHSILDRQDTLSRLTTMVDEFANVGAE
jgi:hypothetical protein